MGPLTVVFDTNVIISAAGFGGVPEQCIIRAFEDDIHVATSKPIIDEVQRVMQYEHLPFNQADIDTIPGAFLMLTDAEFVNPSESLAVIEADPDDDKFLECAVEADADYLVSGDEKHVQPLGQFRDIEIVSPREFLDIVNDVA